jgi:hypothetical protein
MCPNGTQTENEEMCPNRSQILPTNERQVRPITKLKPQQQSEVSQTAVEETGGKVLNGTFEKLKPGRGYLVGCRVAGSFLRQLNFSCVKEFNIFLILQTRTCNPTPSHPDIS